MKSRSRQQFLAICERWCRVTGLSESTLSMHIFGDSRTIDDIRDGRRLDIDKYDAAMRWLEDNPPETWRENNPMGRPPKPKEKDSGDETGNAKPGDGRAA